MYGIESFCLFLSHSLHFFVKKKCQILEKSRKKGIFRKSLKCWRESRFDLRGFEIMKFTGSSFLLTSANRVLVVSGTTNGVTVSTGDDDRVPSLFSCNFCDSLLPFTFLRLRDSRRCTRKAKTVLNVFLYGIARTTSVI